MPVPTVSIAPLGARLRQLREDNGWSQWEMAARMSTRPNRVSDWEVGRHAPTLALLQRIATAYGLTVAQLLDGVM